MKTFKYAIAILVYGSQLWVATTFAKEKESLKETLIDRNKRISIELDKTANIIDSLLSAGGGDRKKNKTTLTIKNTFDWLEGENPTYTPHVDVSLHLPNLEEKWKVRFTSYDEDDRDRGIEKNRLKTEPPRENYGASLALFERFGKIDTTFRPRLEFNSGSLETSYILRFDSEADLASFTFRPSLELFARSDTGTGQFVALNFDRKISETIGFGIINEEQYTSVDHLMEVTHGLRLVHVYTDLISQTHSFNLEYNNKPAYHLSRYTLASAFHHKIYKNVFHYTITPYLLWAENKRFSGRSGVELRIDLIF